MIRARQLMIMVMWPMDGPHHHDHEAQRAAVRGNEAQRAAVHGNEAQRAAVHGNEAQRAAVRGKAGR